MLQNITPAKVAPVDLFQGLEGDDRRGAIVRLVRVVASGRWLPARRQLENGIVLGLRVGGGGEGGYMIPVACS